MKNYEKVNKILPSYMIDLQTDLKIDILID